MLIGIRRSGIGIGCGVGLLWGGLLILRLLIRRLLNWRLLNLRLLILRLLVLRLRVIVLRGGLRGRAIGRGLIGLLSGEGRGCGGQRDDCGDDCCACDA